MTGQREPDAPGTLVPFAPGRTDAADGPGAADAAEFDAVVSMALAITVSGEAPSPETRVRLMDRVVADRVSGFAFALSADDTWQPHAVPGIRMKILALNCRRGYVTLLLDVAPGTRVPPHHHGGAEECYVVSGSLFTCGRRLEAGDFVHADPGTDHGELWTDEGCRVILVVPPEEHLSESQFRQSSPYGRAP